MIANSLPERSASVCALRTGFRRVSRLATPAALLTLWTVSIGCQPVNTYVDPPPPQVTVALPLSEPVQEYFETTGQTRAAQQVDFRARVSGVLHEIRFKDGDLVKEKQVLFVIDKEPYEVAEQSAKAEVARAEAELRLAKQQLNRIESLAKIEAATEDTLDVQMARADSATADLATAEAALRNARLNLEYTEILAPFSGRMGRHRVDIGNLINVNDTVLGSLETVDPIHAYFSLSEQELLRFLELQREGRISISESDPIIVEMALGDSDEFAFEGKLDFREFGIDRSTGTTERRAVFSNEDGRLIPGLFVRLRAAVGKPIERLLVDERAVSADQRGSYLLVVNDKNIVETRLVKLGMLKAGMRAIESGLNANDRVVINGLQKARPGSQVDPQLEQMDARMKSMNGKFDEEQRLERAQSTE